MPFCTYLVVYISASFIFCHSPLFCLRFFALVPRHFWVNEHLIAAPLPSYATLNYYCAPFPCLCLVLLCIRRGMACGGVVWWCTEFAKRYRCKGKSGTINFHCLNTRALTSPPSPLYWHGTAHFGGGRAPPPIPHQNRSHRGIAT